MLPPIHFFRRPHMHMWGRPMIVPWMNPWDRMMIKMLQPMLIGGMISNFGQSIANIISGSKNSVNGQCNCANNNMFSYGQYNNNYYDNTMTSGMYPYVNLSNTRGNNTEGKGGTNNSDTISEMKAAYSKQGISSIYKGEDGRYFAVTNDGKQLSALSLSDLSDEIGDYISKNKAAKTEEIPYDGASVDKSGNIKKSQNKSVTPDNKDVTPENKVNYSTHFARNEWHRYLKDKNNRADEYKNVSMELGRADSKDAHGKIPAEYAINTLIKQLGLTGINYESQTYKDLLSDFINMNQSLFDIEGNMKTGYQNHIDKLDLPSKNTLINDYHLKDKRLNASQSVSSNIKRIINEFEKRHNWLNTSYNDKQKVKKEIQSVCNSLSSKERAEVFDKLLKEGINISNYL